MLVRPSNPSTTKGVSVKNRSPIAVLLLPFVTLGIYSLVWFVKTKDEMNGLGTSIPTAWLLIIPFVNLYWLWVYCTGVGQVTRGSLSAPVSFLLNFCLGPIGHAIIQNEFNKVALPQPMAVPGA